jgi:hypothetical protein
MNDMTNFPEAAYVQTDSLENWKRRLQDMDDRELERHQERLKRAIDSQAANGGEKKRLECMLEACNDQRAVLNAPKEVERKLLVNREGNVPWTRSPFNTLPVEKQVSEVRCETCKDVFKIYCEDDIPADELDTLKQRAEQEAVKQFTDLHATLAGHKESMRISVSYPPSNKTS